MKNPFKSYLFIALSVFGSGLVMAAPILSEPFDYTAGSSLDTLSGGSGWSGAWSLTSGSAPSIASPGLGFGGLDATGNGALQSASATENSVTRGFPAIGTAVTSGSPQTVWLSALVKGNGSDANNSYLALLRNSGSAASDEIVRIGRMVGASGCRVASSASLASTAGTSLTWDSSTRLVVLKIQLQRGGAGTGTTFYSVDFWSPASLPVTEGSLGASQMSFTTNVLGSGTGLDKVRLYDSASGANATFDEIRLGDTLDDVLPPDTTAPAWSSGWPKADTQTLNGFTVRAKTNETGTAYYVVLADGAAAPTASQVRNGLDASNAAATAANSIALTADVEGANVVSGLPDSTAYDVYVVAEDSLANLQSSPIKIDVSTLNSLYVHEPFDYTASSALDTANGGTGFGAAWSLTSGTSPLVGAGSLSYGSLSSSGNQAAQAAGYSITRAFGALGTGVTSSSSQTVWLSFVMQGNGNNSNDAYLALLRNSGSGSTDEIIRIGRKSLVTGGQITLSSAAGTTPAQTAFGNITFDTTTRLMVAKIELQRSGAGTGTNVYTVNLWAPTPTTIPVDESSLGASLANFTTNALGSGTGLDKLRLFAGASGAQAAIDEIRIGATYESVTPIAGGPADPYDTWALGTFANPFGNDDPAVDFDNDGLKNLMEFVLGGDPTISDNPSVAPSGSSSGTNLVLTFKRSDAAEQSPATAVVLQTSTDLVNWTDDTTIGTIDGSGPNGITYTVAENGSAADNIVVIVPKNSALKKFARVTATK